MRAFCPKSATWRRNLTQAALEGTAWLTAGIFLGGTAVLWVDQTFMLPQRVRLAFLAASSIVLGAAIWRWLVLPWARCDWGMLIDAAALRYPEARDYLRPAWDLGRRQGCPGTSEQLRQAHLDATEILLASLPVRPVFQWRASARLRAAGVACAAAALALPWMSSRTAWDRLLRPWRDVPLEHFFKISPGDAQVDWGRGVTIGAGWSAAEPASRARHELKLWIKAGQGWKKAAWDKVSGGDYGYSAEELTSPLQYRKAWRDHASAVYTLTPVSLPQLDSVRARLHGAETQTAAMTRPNPCPSCAARS